MKTSRSYYFGIGLLLQLVPGFLCTCLSYDTLST
jgi:hypothetical protein